MPDVLVLVAPGARWSHREGRGTIERFDPCRPAQTRRREPRRSAPGKPTAAEDFPLRDPGHARGSRGQDGVAATDALTLARSNPTVVATVEGAEASAPGNESPHGLLVFDDTANEDAFFTRSIQQSTFRPQPSAEAGNFTMLLMSCRAGPLFTWLRAKRLHDDPGRVYPVPLTPLSRESKSIWANYLIGDVLADRLADEEMLSLFNVMLSKMEVMAPAIRADPEKLDKAIAAEFVSALGPLPEEEEGLLSKIYAVAAEQLVRGHSKFTNVDSQCPVGQVANK